MGEFSNRTSAVGHRMRRAVGWIMGAACLALMGCAGMHGSSDPVPDEAPIAAPVVAPATPAAEAEPQAVSDPDEIHVLVDQSVTARTASAEREIERLRQDLAAAERALIDRESGTRVDRSRADAVTRVAEARVQVGRAAREARWLTEEVEAAKTQLDRAGVQLEAEHFSAAILLAESASRIATGSLGLAREAATLEGAREVGADRVNLRAGPSTEDAVLAVLAEGPPIVPEREGEGWLFVRTAFDQRGWIREDLVR